MPTQLGVVPQYPPRQVEVNTISATNAVMPVKNISTADVPEEGRLVRVGNMLQIVPERYQTYSNIYYIVVLLYILYVCKQMVLSDLVYNFCFHLDPSIKQLITSLH